MVIALVGERAAGSRACRSRPRRYEQPPRPPHDELDDEPHSWRAAHDRHDAALLRVDRPIPACATQHLYGATMRSRAGQNRASGLSSETRPIICERMLTCS